MTVSMHVRRNILYQLSHVSIQVLLYSLSIQCKIFLLCIVSHDVGHAGIIYVPLLCIFMRNFIYNYSVYVEVIHPCTFPHSLHRLRFFPAVKYLIIMLPDAICYAKHALNRMHFNNTLHCMVSCSCTSHMGFSEKRHIRMYSVFSTFICTHIPLERHNLIIVQLLIYAMYDIVLYIMAAALHWFICTCIVYCLLAYTCIIYNYEE